MTKTVAILQSNYLPWRGYFDLMRRCDLFILSDTVQYTKKDWRNRNVIKTPSGTHWLTVPVRWDSRAATPIDEVEMADPLWASKHIEVLKHNYRRAAAYEEQAPWLFGLLQSVAGERLLTRVNTRLLTDIAARLGITTPIVHSTHLIARERLSVLEKNERTLAICQAAGATRYLSGPAAKVYLDESVYADRGIEVAWMSYEGYPAYPQLWGGFEPNVSIVDLLLNTGARASSYFPSLAERGRALPCLAVGSRGRTPMTRTSHQC